MWLATLGLGVLSGAAAPLTAWLSKLLVDALTGQAVRVSHVVILAVTASLTGTAVMIMGAMSTLVSAVARRAMDLAVTDRLYAAVNRFSGLGRFENPTFHDTLRLAEQAAQEAPVGLSSMMLTVLRGLVTIGGYAGVLLLVWPPMALILAGITIPALWSQLSLGRQEACVSEQVMHLYRQRLSLRMLLTDVTTVQEVRLFGLGELLRGRMIGALRQASGAELAITRKTALSYTRLTAIGGLAVAAALTVVAWRAARGGLTAGDFVLFVAAVAGVQGTLTGLTAQLAAFGKSMHQFRHYLELTDAGDDIAGGIRDVPPLRRGITLRDVWFRYDPASEWVLRGASLELPAGQSVALVGLNGAGKTTLIKLLCRFYDPEHGQILWDGVDIRRFDVARLRQRLTVTSQEFVTYDLTAAENIGVGRLAHLDNRDRIRRAARLAELDEVLTGLPRGYDTLLSREFDDDVRCDDGPDEDDIGSHNGGYHAESNSRRRFRSVRLSVGQGQRLALARALMRDDADLMILDEPSSGLDPQAEYEIHESLRTLRTGRTSLLVSHRLSTIRTADVIAVLVGGRIEERGSHDDLMAAGGEYARLFTLQAGSYQDQHVAVAVASRQL